MAHLAQARCWICSLTCQSLTHQMREMYLMDLQIMSEDQFIQTVVSKGVYLSRTQSAQNAQNAPSSHIVVLNMTVRLHAQIRQLQPPLCLHLALLYLTLSPAQKLLRNRLHVRKKRFRFIPRAVLCWSLTKTHSSWVQVCSTRLLLPSPNKDKVRKR